MLKFKEFVDEEYVSEEILAMHKGKKLIATSHLLDRQKERGATRDEVHDIFRKAADHLSQNDYGDHEKFLFYSKKHDRAIAFAHARNANDKKDKRRHLIATTIFPKGDTYANKETKMIQVEGAKFPAGSSASFSPEFIAYVNRFVCESTTFEEPLTEVIVEGVEFYFLNGVLDSLPFTEFVELD